MSTAGRPDAHAPSVSDVAGRLRDAAFVRLVAAGTGDGVAATGLLVRALEAAAVPYQLSVSPLPGGTDRATDADLTLAAGRPAADADLTIGTEGNGASRTAYSVAAELGGQPDLALALAGVVAAGGYPDGKLLERADDRGIKRRPGVAIPSTDHADGLAHSTLVHAGFSGDRAATAEGLGAAALPDTVDEDARRRTASLVALTVAGEAAATPRAATLVERVLRPLAGGPFETIGGYADVLDAVARSRPGLAVPLALGGVDSETALSAWRAHAESAHSGVRDATTKRYDGLFVARCADGVPVGTVARLLRDFRSPEPVVLVVTDSRAAAVRVPEEAADAGAVDPEDVGGTIREAARRVGATGAGTPTRGRARLEDATPTDLVAAFREAA